MSLGEEIFRALTGGAPGKDSFGGMLHSIRQQYPSRRAMSRATGIPETTLRRWDTQGIVPKAQEAAMPRVREAYRASLLNKSTADRWRNNGMVIHVAGVPGKSPNRSLSDRNLNLKPDTGKNVVDKFLAGDMPGAALAFRAGIQDDFYRNDMFGDWIDDSDLAYEDGDNEGYAVSVSGAT